MHTNKAYSCRCTHNHLKIFLEILNINVTSNDLFMICKENILMMHYHAIFHVVDISVAIKMHRSPTIVFLLFSIKAFDVLGL